MIYSLFTVHTLFSKKILGYIKFRYLISVANFERQSQTMSQLTRYLLRSLPTSRAAKVLSSSNSERTKKVQCASIQNVKLVELHEKLYVSKDMAPQLRGLRLHNHHSYQPVAIQFPVPETPISDILRRREHADANARDLG
jgi:hypothetical protein